MIVCISYHQEHVSASCILLFSSRIIVLRICDFLFCTANIASFHHRSALSSPNAFLLHRRILQPRFSSPTPFLGAYRNFPLPPSQQILNNVDLKNRHNKPETHRYLGIHRLIFRDIFSIFTTSNCRTANARFLWILCSKKHWSCEEYLCVFCWFAQFPLLDPVISRGFSSSEKSEGTTSSVTGSSLRQ
jgi:hypothetical protein